MSLNKMRLLLLILFLSSPWVWIYIRNLPRITSNLGQISILSTKSHVFLTEINNLQTLSRESELGVGSRIVINKYTLYFRHAVGRYLESFDFKYLFFSGDLDSLKTTKENGPLLLALLPVVFIGLSTIIFKRNWKVILLTLISPLPAAFVEPHYETTLRLIYLSLLIYIASIGVITLKKTNIKLLFLWIIILIYDFARFIHFFVNHYKNA